MNSASIKGGIASTRFPSMKPSPPSLSITASVAALTGQHDRKRIDDLQKKLDETIRDHEAAAAKTPKVLRLIEKYKKANKG